MAPKGQKVLAHHVLANTRHEGGNGGGYRQGGQLAAISNNQSDTLTTNQSVTELRRNTVKLPPQLRLTVAH